MSLNITDLELLLIDKVANTTDHEQFLIYSKILAKLKNQYVEVLDEYANLGSAADNEGEIVFIQDLCRVFYSDGTNWKRIGLDPGTVASQNYFLGREYLAGVPQIYSNTCYFTFYPNEHPILTDFTKVSVGYGHAAAIKSDNTLWTWGCGTGGRLGNNCTYGQSSPVSVVGGFTDWCHVSAGTSMTAAVRSNGTLWTFGTDCCGSLGVSNYYVYNSSPVEVSGGFTNWCSVTTLGTFNNRTHGLQTNGTLWSWGHGGYGAIGNNNTNCTNSPVSVVGGFTDWCDVTGNYYSTFGVRSNGTIWAWGSNCQGSLGVNCADQYWSISSPVQIVCGANNWTSVSSTRAQYSTWALRSDGTMWAWGSNNCNYAPLGTACDSTNPSQQCISYPVEVLGGYSDWCFLGEAFQNQIIAIRTTGDAYGIGKPCNGSLGVGVASPSCQDLHCLRLSPTAICSDFSDWCFAVSGGVACNWPSCTDMQSFLIRPNCTY